MRQLRRDLRNRAPHIAAMLGLTERDFELSWMTTDQYGDSPAVAFSGSGLILLNWSWFRKHPRDYGCLAHEYTHVVQNVPGGSAPGEIIEGFADAVRFRLGLYDSSWWSPSPIAKKIAWLSQEDFVALSRSLASGTYYSAPLV